MRKTALIPLFIMVLLRGYAQTDERCAVKRIEDTEQFEQWLSSRRAASAVQAEPNVRRIPVVVHVLHVGEPLGEGHNYPSERIHTQIRTLNEDYRRKENTPGFNTHPDGGDTRIEFVLAQYDPEGNPTDGIVRVDINDVHLPEDEPSDDFLHLCSMFSYWDPERYFNIWCIYLEGPFGGPSPILGSSRFPVTDLDGLKDLPQLRGDGVVINAPYFGIGSDNDPRYNMGRTLTHEIGHSLGLLHTYAHECQYSEDYCDDTPNAAPNTTGCPSSRPVSCDGRPVMIENYMDLSNDVCMSIFTNDQILRMHTVLNNSPRRSSLLTSTAIDRSDDVTGTPDDVNPVITLYPNPATDRLYLSVDESMLGRDVRITAHSLLGKALFRRSLTLTGRETEIPVSDIHEKVIVLTIEGGQKVYREKIVIE